MNFYIVDESGMTADELETTRLAILEYLGPLKPWNFGKSEVSVGVPVPSQTSYLEVLVPIYITKRKRRLTAAGYHTVENGVPTIYVVPRANKFGTYYAPKPAVPAKKIGTFTLRARPVTPAKFIAGQLATICHEVAEVLGDPLVKTISNPDSLGHNYLREITDPVHGIYYKATVKGVNCVLPDTVLPNWYELGSNPPYDVMLYCTAPFQKAPKGYAYWVDKFGKFFKV